MSAVLPAIVIVPLAAALAIALSSRSSGRSADVLGNAATFVVLGLAVAMAFPVLTGPELSWSFGDTSPLGINLVANAFSVLMLLVISIDSVAASIYSIAYMEEYTSKAKYYVLFLLMIAGMNIVVLGADLVNMYIGIEVAALSCYALVAYGLGREYLEASFRYQILGTVGTLCLVGGIGLLYSQGGTVSFAGLLASDASAVADFRVPAILIMSGLALKAAFMPYHAWLPDAHSTAPSPVSGMLSGVFVKVIGVYGLFRLLFLVFEPGDVLATALLVIASVSIVAGALLALAQMDMKRLLAYHTISQMGYVLLGLAVGTPLALAGALFHLVNHALFKELFFLGAGSVERQTGTRDIAVLGGLNSRMPVTGVTSAIGFFSISGCPPFNGFWSKLLIIVAAIQAGYVGLGVVGAIGAILTVASFLKYEKGVFFGALPEALQKVKESPTSMWVPSVMLATLCLVLGLMFPWFIEHVLEPAVRVIMLGA